MADNSDYLARVELFAGVPRARLDEMAQFCHRQKLQSGEVLLREGEPGRTLFFVIGGVLRVERYTERGGLVHLAVRSAGDTIGELSILTDGYRTAYVVAHTDVRLLAMDRDHFMAYALQQPEVTRALLSTLAERVRETSGLVVSRSANSVEERLVARLLSLVDASGLIELPDSQTSLASQLGCTREALNRGISKLIVDGMIERIDARRYRWVAM